MAVLVGSIHARYLGSKHQPSKDEMPEMWVYDFIADCYVQEIGSEVTAEQNTKRSANYSHYVIAEDLDQLACLQTLKPNEFYALRVAISAKSGNGNYAKAKFRVLDVLDVHQPVPA
jgi:hypothetical protein